MKNASKNQTGTLRYSLHVWITSLPTRLMHNKFNSVGSRNTFRGQVKRAADRVARSDLQSAAAASQLLQLAALTTKTKRSIDAGHTHRAQPESMRGQQYNRNTKIIKQGARGQVKFNNSDAAEISAATRLHYRTGHRVSRYRFVTTVIQKSEKLTTCMNLPRSLYRLLSTQLSGMRALLKALWRRTKLQWSTTLRNFSLSKNSRNATQRSWHLPDEMCGAHAA